ncbi:hypothetical protein BVC80_1483g6 [Macleaya cordata]|uniref:Caprin-1 dimerization domain-containing protein n=1 Tax=Macleaya cordata TaxID=56857 RepID=A0A200QNF7_MACCD|nr:hypothetical protein BVC80_1483g6 [Macleaya cordata]
MAAAEMGTDGPVLSLMNKRLRALKKKHNRIIQMEEALSQGKPLNKEQEEVLRSKPAVLALIDEYEKLRQPLSTALQEEILLSHQQNQLSSPPPPAEEDSTTKPSPNPNEEEAIVEDLLNLLYFGSLFDVKPQSDFTSTMLTRTHERGCCLTYDYVTDDATDLLVEKDLDLISSLGGLVISRPVHSGVSHKNALRSCLQHAKLWLANSDQPIEPGTSVTYAGLRERLNKILASDYFTTTPEMKAPVEVAAAAGKYAPCQVPVFGSSEPSSVPVQIEDAFPHYQQKDEETTNFQGQETDADQSYPVEEQHPEDESEMLNPTEAVSVQQDQQKPEAEMDEQSLRDVESQEQQYIPRRSYQNQRGGSGGRRGYPNGRGGRSSRGGGGYQNGRSQYYDQPGNYYPRNYHNARGRSGRGGGYPSNNHGSAAHGGGHAPTDALGLGGGWKNKGYVLLKCTLPEVGDPH